MTDDLRVRVAKRLHRVFYYASISGFVPERWIDDEFDETAPQWLTLASDILPLLEVPAERGPNPDVIHILATDWQKFLDCRARFLEEEK